MHKEIWLRASDGWKTFFTNRTFMRLNSVKFCVELLVLSVILWSSMAQFLSSIELTSGGIVVACLHVLLASFIVPLFTTQYSLPSSVILFFFAVEFLLPSLLCTVPFFFSSVHLYPSNQLLHQAHGVVHMAVCKLTTVLHLSNPYME